MSLPGKASPHTQQQKQSLKYLESPTWWRWGAASPRRGLQALETAHTHMFTKPPSAYNQLTDGFDFHQAHLSSLTAPLATAVAYLALVALMTHPRVKAKLNIDTRSAQALHNLALCLFSLVIAVGTFAEVVNRTIFENGSTLWLFCEQDQTQPRGALWFWSYIYYLSKYYELLDTVLQLLKGRPPPSFKLHIFHHAAVLVMAWAWLQYTQSLQFIGMLFNTSVHVVMYYYYFLRSLGYQVSWKRYVTHFQIFQFACSFVCFGVTMALIAGGRNCAGIYALALNSLFNLTLLCQFLGLLRYPRAKVD